MKKILLFILLLTFSVTLSACTSANTVVCGEGTFIEGGKCVAKDIETPNDNETPDDNEIPDVSCDSLSGTVFYEANFTAMESTFVDNEPGNLHTPNNFVIWGDTGTSTALQNASVENGSLIIRDLDGTQLDNYHDRGLGYQFFDYITDTSYTVCAVIEGTQGEYVTSEIGIYYGHGTKDEFSLTGERQMVVQDFRPSLTTNKDYGQYVLFFGNVTGELTIHEILIIEN